MKFGALLIILCITVTVFMISCMEQVNDTEFETNKRILHLSQTSSQHVEDFTTLGIWLFTIKKEEVVQYLKQESDFVLTVNGKGYALKSHKVDPSLLIAFLDETLSVGQIKTGAISCCTANIPHRSTNDVLLTVEKVVITSQRVENGCNTYEMTLEDYLQLKMDSTSIIFSNGVLIRPTCVKSCEENAYLLSRYYDARQASSDHDTDAAFRFLKGRSDHEQLLYFDEPNRLILDGSGNVVINKPEERDRLRQIGREGELNGQNVFFITRDDIKHQFVITLDRDVLSRNPRYSDDYRFEGQLKSSTEFVLTSRDASSVYKSFVSYAENVGTEVIRNARISGDGKINLYDSTGMKRLSCNRMSEAVETAQDGDVIKVGGEFVLNEATQSFVQSKELIITSDDLVYTLDYTGNATRAFLVNGSASLTLQNAVVQQANHSADGGAFLNNGNLIIDNCTLTHNSAATGGAISNNGTSTVKQSVLLHNHATEYGGALSNLKTLYFYNNTLSENTADMGGSGLYIMNDGKVLNSRDEEWRCFNAPHIPVQIIESGTVPENIYTNSGFTEGDWIQFSPSRETTIGTLTLSPSTATEFERRTVEIEYETSVFFAEGSITVDTPEGFTITDDASVIVGNGEATNASVYDLSSNSITITGITQEAGTKITLKLLVNIPMGIVTPVSARNINYIFKVKADADGSGSLWTLSQESVQQFVSFNKSTSTDFRLKAGYDFLRLDTDNATEIIFDIQTAPNTTAASITQAVESVDGSVQQYQLEGPGGLLNLSDNMPDTATLTVTAEHGNTFEFIVFKEYGDFKLFRTAGKYNLYRTLRKAVAGAKNGERCTIESSRTSDIFESEIVIDGSKEIILQPSENVTQMTLNADDNHRVLKISENASVTIKSTIIKKGATTTEGGGIYFTGKRLYLENATITNNYAGEKGGGIYSAGGPLTLTDTTIRYNRCSGKGGGIYIISEVHFDSGEIYSNDAISGKGGGIYWYGGYIFTENGCWNGPPGEIMPGYYNVPFSVDTWGSLSTDLTLPHPAKVYNNYATQGSQMVREH